MSSIKYTEDKAIESNELLTLTEIREIILEEVIGLQVLARPVTASLWSLAVAYMKMRNAGVKHSDKYFHHHRCMH